MTMEEKLARSEAKLSLLFGDARGMIDAAGAYLEHEAKAYAMPGAGRAEMVAWAYVKERKKLLAEMERLEGEGFDGSDDYQELYISELALQAAFERLKREGVG